MKKSIQTILLSSLGILPLLFSGCSTSKEIERPNIVLILVDDMGYSDIGCYGGEIPTPHIDGLAWNGIRFSQFYNTARCCPTRASLLTGLFQHQTGIGQMTNTPRGPETHDRGVPGYRGFLNRNCVTMAEVLRDAGYHTYMTGKWHLGYHGLDRYPIQRGFEKYYGCIPGACSYFRPQGNRPLTFMNDHLPPPDTAYYTTDAFTDYALKFMEEQEDEQPFFLYVAYNAPHWPLHAKEEDIEKFVGKYMVGWDEIRKQRYAKQQQLGLFTSDWGLSERDPRVRPWAEVEEEQKVRSDYRMAVYAAQVYSVDYNVGRIIAALKEREELDNTLILFLSDNGACAEMYDEFGSKHDSLINDPDFSGAVSYGIGWANASNTPLYEYKVRSYEGGISTPLIAHWPEEITRQAGKITHQPGYLIDLMPTILEVSGASYPETYHGGKKIQPLPGLSLLETLKTGDGPDHTYMYWEHANFSAIRKGAWKAFKKVNERQWQLFNLVEDRIEMNDIAADYPEMVRELGEEWYRWANQNYVLPKSTE